MHPEDIKAELRKAKSRQALIARKLDVTEAAVYLVIHGQTKSRRIAEAICEAINKPIGYVWPGKYPEAEKFAAMGAKGGVAAQLKAFDATHSRTAQRATKRA